MTEKEKLCILHVFDEAICAVGQKLIKIDIHKTDNTTSWKDEIATDECKGMIRISGSINATLVYSFPKELYQYIVVTMGRGDVSDKEERQLYIGEFINITCGYAISKWNDYSGKYSRISVPRLYTTKEKVEEIPKDDRIGLCYQTKKGKLHVGVHMK